MSAQQEIHCGGSTCSCPSGGGDGCCGYGNCCSSESSPTYRPANDQDPSGVRLYVVGNIFNHVQPFELDGFGQGVAIGNQIQARVANNTFDQCAYGVKIAQTHSTGECPPGPDLSSDRGKTRNTRVAVMNNVMLNMLDYGNDSGDVHVGTGPPAYPFTLTQGKFGHNLHYGEYRAFRLPNGQTYLTVDQLQNAPGGYGYGIGSKGDIPEDNPNLVNPSDLLFDLTAGSPTFMFTGGVKDEAYDTFLSLTGAAGPFAGFPSIYHDYDHHMYSGTTCPMGAYGN